MKHSVYLEKFFVAMIWLTSFGGLSLLDCSFADEMAVTSVGSGCPFGVGLCSYINADLPLKVDGKQEFKMDIWVEDRPRDNSGGAGVTTTHEASAVDEPATRVDSGSVEPVIGVPVPIVMEQTNVVAYEPREFEVLPGQRKTVTVKILRPSAGLTEVRAMAPSRYEPLSVTVNSGFAGRLVYALPKEVEAGTTRSFVMRIVDEKGGPLPLGAECLLVIEATGVDLSLGGKEWASTIKIKLGAGENSTPILQARTNTWSARDGLIQARLLINPQRKSPSVIATETAKLQINPAWWVSLLATAVGGVFSSLYALGSAWRTAKGRRQPVIKTVGTLLAGSLAGCLAYFLATWNILGINVDVSSLRGFFFLGFLCSYLGVESIMSRALGGESRRVSAPR